MSRVGYLSITVPNEVEVTILDGGSFGYKEVKVKGPKGELSKSIRRGIDIHQDGKVLSVSRNNDTKQMKSYHGLYRSLVQNMIDGVLNGYEKELEIVGIGYRFESQGNLITFSVGLSHKITFEPPEGISIDIIDQNNLKVSGADKQLVGEVASKIRSFRVPEPYKGKGIRYKGEQLRRRSAKATI